MAPRCPRSAVAVLFCILAAAMLFACPTAARRVLASVPYAVRGDVDVVGPNGAKGALLPGGQLLIDWALLDKGYARVRALRAHLNAPCMPALMHPAVLMHPGVLMHPAAPVAATPGSAPYVPRPHPRPSPAQRRRWPRAWCVPRVERGRGWRGARAVRAPL
jgi:hypothetical protein